MRPKRHVSSRIAVCVAALFSAAATVAGLAPQASAAPSALPLPIPGAGGGGEPLVNVDGHVFAQPLVNNLNLPTLKK
jgi:poly(3-hydroxybutyrate) depolymerase